MKYLTWSNNKVEELKTVIHLIEKKLNKKAKLNLKEIQPGDVKATFADINYSKKMLDYSPKTSLEEEEYRYLSIGIKHKAYINLDF